MKKSLNCLLEFNRNWQGKKKRNQSKYIFQLEYKESLLGLLKLIKNIGTMLNFLIHTSWGDLLLISF